MIIQGSKAVSHTIITLRVFKGMNKVMGTCSILATLGFSPSIVLRYLWTCLNDEGLNYENGCIPCQHCEVDHIYLLYSLPHHDQKWVKHNCPSLDLMIFTNILVHDSCVLGNFIEESLK